MGVKLGLRLQCCPIPSEDPGPSKIFVPFAGWFVPQFTCTDSCILISNCLRNGEGRGTCEHCLFLSSCSSSWHGAAFCLFIYIFCYVGSYTPTEAGNS